MANRFPYDALEDWFGGTFNARLVDAMFELSPDEAVSLTQYLRGCSQQPSAEPRASRPGELRPHVTTMRVLDAFWGPRNLVDRLCAVLMYAHSATVFDPLTYTVEDWFRYPEREKLVPELPELLARPAQLLLAMHPLVEVGVLELAPTRYVREFADDLPAVEIVHDLMQRYAESGLNDRIGDFNRDLGGRHPSGRFRGYVHLWEILQDLMLVERYPQTLQPLFVAGFDIQLARLLAPEISTPYTLDLAELAGFRFPVHQAEPSKVVELRGLDDLEVWRDSLQLALSGAGAQGPGLGDVQDFVHATMLPAARRLMKTFESDVFGRIREKATEQLVLGACVGGVSTAFGTSAGAALATGLTSAAVGAAWSGAQARGHSMLIDAPFLSMTPDHSAAPPLAIPTMGIL